MIYSEIFKFLKTNKIFFIITLWIFAVSITLGVLFQPSVVALMLANYLKTLFSQVQGKNFLELFVYILQNNLLTSFFGMLFGIFLGFYSPVITFINGYVIGFVSQRSYEIAGFGTIFSLVPHGIFEIPALIISLGLGLKLGFSFLHNFISKYKQSNYLFLTFVCLVAGFLILGVIFPAILLQLMTFVFFLFFVLFFVDLILTISNKQLRKLFWHDLNYSLLSFIYVVVPLLFIAAIIETCLIFFV